MVLLVQNIYHYLKLSSKLENHHHNHHHHHQSEALPASLKAFQSDVSNHLNQLTSNSKPGSDFLSLLWIKQCLGLLSNLNKAFAKLVMEIDYPMSRWDFPLIEDYLKYSLNLLDILNSISSSLSHLGQARLSISHALTLIESSPQSAIHSLRGIKFKNPTKDLKIEEMEDLGERVCLSKDWAVHEALMVMKSIVYWVCGIVLSGLSGDVRPYLEMRKLARGFHSPSLMALDSSFYEVARETECNLKEVREVNGLVEALAAGGSNGDKEKLEGEMEGMKKMVDCLGKESDDLFAEVLAGRSELVDRVRQRKP